jgi:hypothetical protein
MLRGSRPEEIHARIFTARRHRPFPNASLGFVPCSILASIKVIARFGLGEILNELEDVAGICPAGQEGELVPRSRRRARPAVRPIAAVKSPVTFLPRQRALDPTKEFSGAGEDDAGRSSGLDRLASGRELTGYGINRERYDVVAV